MTIVDDRSDDHLLHRKAMSEAAFDGAKDDYGRRTGVSNVLAVYAAFGGAKGDYGGAKGDYGGAKGDYGGAKGDYGGAKGDCGERLDDETSCRWRQFTAILSPRS